MTTVFCIGCLAMTGLIGLYVFNEYNKSIRAIVPKIFKGRGQ